MIIIIIKIESSFTSSPSLKNMRTFSKSYSMAGGRLGLMFASEELIEHMNKVKDSYNVNALTQAVARFKERHGGTPPRVLDSGSGSGLLAMMAARAGAMEVRGCSV